MDHSNRYVIDEGSRVLPEQLWYHSFRKKLRPRWIKPSRDQLPWSSSNLSELSICSFVICFWWSPGYSCAACVSNPNSNVCLPIVKSNSTFTRSFYSFLIASIKNITTPIFLIFMHLVPKSDSEMKKKHWEWNLKRRNHNLNLAVTQPNWFSSSVTGLLREPTAMMTD